MVRVATLTRRGLQGILWIALLAFLLLVGLARFTPFEVLIVRSGSMEPVIATGGIVVIDRGARSPTVGAIASFRNPDGSLVTHRVVAIEGSRFVTRGDANGANDPIHRPNASVYGTVDFTLPLVGYFINLLRQPAAFLILLLGTGGFLILDSARTIRAELSRMRNERGQVDAT